MAMDVRVNNSDFTHSQRKRKDIKAADVVSQTTQYGYIE
eukprot:CAMPEP_0170452620 /NCGR_PEP_ID=MMETSP0123-20130129/1451_1 /TAXON_ID=182087 /ORGANISM="Favella ehrenbergii, Strain Fehren 1" /LENGTH=38 /DNA_ID= /DNA_START= /DNA_END= /DNA_ORIENTATION=